MAAALPEQGHVSADETPTKEAAMKSWLWTFVTDRFTVFAVRPSRRGEVAAELLTDCFGGAVSCDRAKMYWRFGRLQWCWTHLKRDFQALVDHGDHQLNRLGRDLLRPAQELFRQWSRCRDGTITRRGLKRLLAPVRRQVKSLLLRGYGTDANGMCRDCTSTGTGCGRSSIRKAWSRRTMLPQRSLRHAVIWRKLSFGTQSADGSRFVETLLTVIESCRQQGRDVFAWVTTAVQSRFTGQPCPSVLPGV